MLATRMRSGGGGPPERLLPWLFNVDVFMTPVSQVNWPESSGTSISYLYASVRQSTGAQNAEINFDVVLAAGTWTVELICTTTASSGIYTVQFDGATAGTLDSYSSSTAYNVRMSLTGISIASSGKKGLKLLMATKNASSSSYYGMLQHIQFKRTA